MSKQPQPAPTTSAIDGRTDMDKKLYLAAFGGDNNR